MAYVGIDFDNKINNTHVFGYLRIPDQMYPTWTEGFREYLKDVYKATGGIHIYPLRVRETPETMGLDLSGRTNMRNDFSSALASIVYYPECDETEYIRRQWSTLDPTSTDYKEQ